jgi:hypothetical protein
LIFLLKYTDALYISGVCMANCRPASSVEPRCRILLLRCANNEDKGRQSRRFLQNLKTDLSLLTDPVCVSWAASRIPWGICLIPTLGFYCKADWFSSSFCFN